MSKRRRSKVRNGFIIVTSPKKRDYVTEYARRLARAIAKARRRKRKRGSPKVVETTAESPKRAPRDDKKLQRGLKALRKSNSLTAAAHTAHVSPDRLRRFATRKGVIRKKRGRWVVTADLPRRMLVFSGGREITVTVLNYRSARVIGKYMNAVKQFAGTGKPEVLAPFVGRNVKDTAGNSHPFETNPNVIYRLVSTGDQAFEKIYRIVV